MNQNRKIHESFSWLMCFPLVCWPLSAALLRKNLVMRMRELRKEEENVRGAGGGHTRGENFSVCWSSEKTASSGKQMQASRAEERQMGMVRKTGKDKETFAEWK